MKSSINVVVAGDEAYAMPLGVTLHSMLKHLDKATRVTLYIFDGGLSDDSKKRIARIIQKSGRTVETSWIAPSAEQMNGLVGSRHLSSSTYLRILIPQLLPQNVQRALYLDGDLLIKADITPLYEVDFQGKAIAACIDYAINTISHPWCGVKNYEELGIPADSPNFNGGILLFDVEKWRREGIDQKVLSYAIEHAGDLGNCDQDALNAVLTLSWQPVDLEWNMQSCYFDPRQLDEYAFTREIQQKHPKLLQEGKIFHFTGSSKPWNHWTYHPLNDEWRHSLLESGWFTPSESVSWSTSWFLKRSVYKAKALAGRA